MEEPILTILGLLDEETMPFAPAEATRRRHAQGTDDSGGPRNGRLSEESELHILMDHLSRKNGYGQGGYWSILFEIEQRTF